MKENTQNTPGQHSIHDQSIQDKIASGDKDLESKD